MRNERTAKVTEVLIHNPAQPTTWPGERTRNMANKKKGGKKGKTRNSATMKTARPAANKKVRNTAKPKSHKKGGYKRNGGSWLRNTLAGAFSGISIPTALGVGGGVLAAKASDLVMPASEWSGIGVQASLALLIAYFAGKSKVGAGVAVGLAGVAIYNGVNKLSNNAVDNAVLGTVARFRPAPALPAVNDAAAGMSGFNSYPRAVRIA